MGQVINKSLKVLKNFGYFPVYEFQKAFILLVEGVWGIGVNVDLADIFAI